MKNFTYQWCENLFLIHIQLNNKLKAQDEVKLLRFFDGKTTKTEVISIKSTMDSYRFIVSRSHPQEKGFSIEYNDEMILDAFKIDDRAYYPTESFYSE